MKVFYDKDADLSLIKGKNVTIIGYGSQVMPMLRTSMTAVSRSRWACVAAAPPGPRWRRPA